MVVRKRDAHLALDQLVEYRNHLDSRIDGALISALNRLMNVFQSRLFLALLDIQEFYESTLLDPSKNNDEKTAAALDVAIRWENISSPSLVASTIDLRRSPSNNNLSSFDRARSLYQLNLAGDLGVEQDNLILDTPHRTNLNRLQRERQQPNQSNSTLSFSMPNYSPSIGSYKWNDDGAQQVRDSVFHSNVAYTTEYGVYDNVRVPTPDKLVQQRPVAKPRQRRLRKTKNTTDQLVRAFPYQPEWTVDRDSSKSSQTNQRTARKPTHSNENDEDSVVGRQWSLLSHLPITTEVIINKTAEGFGFSIAGGQSMAADGMDKRSDIFITRVNPGGAADREGGMQVGDRIISVNGISLIGVSHEEAVRALQLSGNRLKLVVERKNPQSISEASSSVSLPPLQAGNRTHNLPAAKSAHAKISGSGASNGSAGAMSTSSAGLTNTSLASGSLFDPHGASKHALVSRSTVENNNPPLASEKSVSPSESIGQIQTDETPIEEGSAVKRQSSLDMGYVNPLDCKLLSGVIKSATTDRKSRKSAMPSGFPAFSWCAGLQKPTGCAAMLGTHRSLPDSNASSRRNRTSSSESRGKQSGTPGISKSARPVPAPQPGPLVVEVTLLRGTRSGLGFSIAGGVGNETVDGDSGIFITKLTLGGVAETDGRIAVGDRIVQVNECSLVEVTHEQAVKTLRQAGDEVRLILVKQSVRPSRMIWSSDQEKQSAGTQDISKLTTSPTTEQSGQGSPKTSRTQDAMEDLCSPRHSPTAQHAHGDFESKTVENHGDNGNGPYFASTGQELLESQMAGLIDYAAAASVANLVSKWPKARLITLYRSGRHAATNQPVSEKRKHRRSRSVGGSLGLNIVGGDGSEATFVSQVQPDKPAGLSKRIFVGDRLLAVNGIDVSEHGHEQAAAALRGAPDRVDLVLVYCPDEYAEFEKYYSRQLKAVGHKISTKAVKQLNRESTEIKQEHKGKKLTRSRKPSDYLSPEPDSPSLSALPVFQGSEMFLRCQVDYDPNKESHQAVPKKAFALRSGDLICVVNWSDPEWWEAQRIDPMSSDMIGHVGLVPSRQRLERRERTRTRHVNFLARAARSSESGSLEHSLSSGQIESGVTHRRDHSLGVAVSVNSLVSTGAHHSDRRGRSSSVTNTIDKFVLSYITVTPVQLSFARPVVVLGHMKDRIADELLCEFPDRFGTAVPYTTRACRPDEVEGRDYHFVVSREIMVADIAAQRYLEAGEYNGNLYGTHLESVFEVAELGLHCLLDVGGPALRRLEAAGLPPIAILVLPETFSSYSSPTSAKSMETSSGQGSHTSQKSKSTEFTTINNSQIKLARILRHFSNHLTAIITTDDFDLAYNRVKELIVDNSGPVVWLNSPQPIP